MLIREQTEKIEEQILSRHASLSKNSRGREREEYPCPIRTVYQRDRDRVLHCNAFKRLKHKTQVFLSPKHDHYRTRLTHSLEVSQIARTVARALRLNEDLTEAIALAHDLGHTPFGHAGERVLNDVCPYGFKHAENSVRVVQFIENNGEGLNLTFEVLDGILHHSYGAEAKTLEGRLVRICDKVAYINHDIEDAIRAGIITYHDLPYQCVYVLGNTKSKRISTIVNSLIAHSNEDIQMDKSVELAHNNLRNYMFQYIYTKTEAQKEQDKAEYIVRNLYKYYKKHMEKLPAFFKEIAKKEDDDRAVCDYIACMSDTYIVEQYEELFVPKAWNK